MGVTSDNLEKLGIVDETIPEPLGGAHRDIDSMCATLKESLSRQLDELSGLAIEDLLEKRFDRLMAYGRPD